VLRLALLLAALGLSACTTATDVADASGQRQVIIRCGTAVLGPCVRRAEQECGGAYDVLETNEGFSANSLRVRCRNRG
jgi:hypothetical protein